MKILFASAEPLRSRQAIATHIGEIVSGLKSTGHEVTICVSRVMGPYDRTSLYRRVVRILTSAGLGDRASVQLLRHTYGYLAYKRTHGNLLFVQQQLGHAHPMVTAIYAQFVKFSYSDLADNVGGRAVGMETPPSKQPAHLRHLRKAKK